MDKMDIAAEMTEKMRSEIAEHITELEDKIREYGSFNVIANAVARNQLAAFQHYSKQTDEPSPIVPEYIALICLKFPYSLGFREFTQTRDVAKDLYEITELARQIVSKYTFIHYRKFEVFDKDGNFSDMDFFAQTLSADELLVRNETFESHHWDLLEDLYTSYDEYFQQTLGFTINEAIRICITIADHLQEKLQKAMNDIRTSSKQMYEEIKAYKYRKKIPKNFYPPEYLEMYEKMDDRDIEWEFQASMTTYQMVMLGHNLSFTAEDIAKMEDIEVDIIRQFLGKLSIQFGEVNPDFSSPEIIHPLKDRPLIRHEERYLCPSTSLLDYSLDRLFADTLIKDSKKSPKYLLSRHDYLVEKGMEYFSKTLGTENFHTHLSYPGGEMDGLIVCDNNVFFIEAKGHRITDRAKKGYIDRLENHVDDIIKESHEQAIRSYNYLFGKKDIPFKTKAGKNIIIDGSGLKQAYFISLTIESLRTISCNLKIGNSLGLFNSNTFPWIVCLYDLRVVCEHMEGPAYFMQYLHRRKEFFKYKKFTVMDELDLLGYYLNRNLRFEDIVNAPGYNDTSIVHLDTYMPVFNNYYFYEQGVTKKPVAKMVHYSSSYVKNLVKALEHSGIPNSIIMAVQVLELGSKTKKEFMEYLIRIKKRFKKDGDNHDFRIAGDDSDGKSWMISYWVGEDHDGLLGYFKDFVQKTNQKEPHNSYLAVFDTGRNAYQFKEIVYLMNP